jgi:dihydrofolate synthase / folylpolyglutamate synthase
MTLMTCHPPSQTPPGITWLNSLPPWDGKNFSPLEIPQKILSHLSDPQNTYSCIHIAGTNGKGSVANYLSSILQREHPFSNIGLMTSPHLLQVEERANINGLPCSAESLSEALLQVKKTCETAHLAPTYFVAITCAIFLLFKTQEVEYAVIETGMGGRYDVTNLIAAPLLSVITSIGMDHEEHLGSTLRSIAWNKGGIIKKNIPVVCGMLPDEAHDEIKTIADSMQSTFHCFEQNSKYDFAVSSKNFPNLHGFPKQNALLACQAAHILGCRTESITQGITSAKVAGRAELLQYNGLHILLDAAHNSDGMRALLRYVNELVRLNHFESVSCIFGFLDRKNWNNSLQAISSEVMQFSTPPVFYWHSFSAAAVPASKLMEKFGSGFVINKLESLLSNPSSSRGGRQLYVIAGSFGMLEAALISLNTKTPFKA